MKTELKTGQRVWYWSATYEMYKQDTVEQYCKVTKCWWLDFADDWFHESELYHTKRECAHASFPTPAKDGNKEGR